jgi:hypothetical protein
MRTGLKSLINIIWRNSNIKITRGYCYIVYECSEHGSVVVEGKIHGVYLNISEAMGKKVKLHNLLSTRGYIAILKKPLEGKDLTYE